MATDITDYRLDNVSRTKESARAILMRGAAIHRERFGHYETLATLTASARRALNDRLTQIQNDKFAEQSAWDRTLIEYARVSKGVPKEEVEQHNREVAAFNERRQMTELELANAPSFFQFDELEKFVKRSDPATWIIAEVDVPEADDLLGQYEDAKSAADVAMKKLAKAESAPRDYDFSVASIKAELDRLEAAGKPDLKEVSRILDFTRSGKFQIDQSFGSITWPTFYPILGDNSVQHFNAQAAFVWLHRAAIEKKLIAALGPRESFVGMSVEEKVKAVETAQDEVAAAIRWENEVLIALEQAGSTGLRRRTIAPQVALRIDCSPKVVAEYTA